MSPRAIKNLAQLPDNQFLVELSKGMRLCVLNSLQLWRDARILLGKDHLQGFNILKMFVEEEAAKFHILLDAARCPRQPTDILERHLKYFTQHLAKGLYALYYNLYSPTDLAEVRQHLYRERQALYLDGPSNVDWVFRNDILRQREESIYVDYVAYEDGYKKEEFWHWPDKRRLRIGLGRERPKVLHVAAALHGAGLTSVEALPIVSNVWRQVTIDDSLNWSELRQVNIQTLQMIDEKGLLRRRPQTVYCSIANDWLFPLFPLDLGELQVRPEDLRKIQRSSTPTD
ncbi:MAG: AbiV family abortive infection protein [Bryobacterales bacterium]|nr:AbiV family abortive infection protein [Bryobacterales bacterium]